MLFVYVVNATYKMNFDNDHLKKLFNKIGIVIK